MTKDIELYLNGEKVELPDKFSLEFTYEITDYTNPTVIKNSFSKTVTIDGTPNNNNIFNHIWNLERVMDEDFTLFNPSQRVPFELYNNSEIVEKGYCKLDSIERNGYKIGYNLTLYGGLGSFFYSLAYDVDSDKEKTLADLNYTYSVNPDDEFDFEINKNTVWNAWDALRMNNHNTGTYRKWDYINFIPAYNGYPDDFDADKVLINVHSATGMSVRYTDEKGIHYGTLPTTIDSEGTAYTTYNGYLYGEMRRECDEWEMRDLRSYLQRPALSVHALFEGICNPQNNGGYDVVLDPDFFSSGNPYYDKAWITLPMMNSSMVSNDSYEDWDWYYGDTVEEQRPRKVYVKIDNVSSFSGTPDVLNIKCEIYATITGTTANTLYMSTWYHSSSLQQDGAPVGDWRAHNMTACQFYINRNGNIGSDYVDDIASSNRLILATKLDGHYYWSQGVTGFTDMPATNTTVQWCFGTWKKVKNNKYVWTMEDGSTQISVDLEVNKMSDIPLIAFTTKSICNNDPQYAGYAYKDTYYNSRAEMNANSYSHLFMERPVNRYSKVTYKGGYSVRSNQQLKKKDILGGINGTPTDWLLSYCKLFGLFIEKDKFEDVIYIRLRNNWYKDEQIDLEKLIDRSKETNIQPLTFESKWYNFNYGEAEGKFLDSYKKSYSQDFGKQMIDTKYNFDADDIDLLQDTKFRNGLFALEKSNYFNIKYDPKQFSIFPCIYDWCTVNYYNNGDEHSVYMALPAGTTTVVLNPNTPKEFNDFLPKLQFHNDEKGSVDGDGVLVFFNGLKNTGDVDYWITDDVNEMFDLSDNPCWLQTRQEWDVKWENRIAIETHTLPEFSRYVLHNKIITATWDFGYTKELYVPYYRYDVNRTPTLYENFWKSYIQDLYSVNTRKVDCYVNLNTSDVYDFMRKFYWWDNSMWVCTKVSDYDICLDRSTLCSFTKVNDIGSYLEMPTFDDYFFNFYRLYTGGNVPAQGTDEERSIYLNIDSSSNWIVIDGGVPYSTFDPDSPTGGTFGYGYTVKATFMPNYSTVERVCTYVAGNAEGNQIFITVKQDGYVKQTYLTATPSTITLPVQVSTPVNITVESSSDWEVFPNSWTYFNPESGHSGTTIMTLSASTNQGSSNRTARIGLRNSDQMGAYLNITQKSESATLEQNEILPVYTVSAAPASQYSFLDVHYRLVSEVECQIIPWGSTSAFTEAMGQISYNTTIQPTTGTNFWIRFQPNTASTVSRNASFYAYYVDSQGGRHSIFPTAVPLPLVQEGSGNTTVELNASAHPNATATLGANLRWTATTNTSWITITASTGTSATTSVHFSTPMNTGSYRTGYILVAYLDDMGYYRNETIIVNQAGDSGLIVNPTAVTVTEKGGSFIISVTSSTEYSVYSSASWCEADRNRDGTFVLNIAPNNGFARNASVVVTSGSHTATITIYQSSKYVEEFTLDYAPSSVVFDSSGGTMQITIRSNSPWTINNAQ